MTTRAKTNTAATEEKKKEDKKNESSDEDEIEPPRSQSEPPMKWVESRIHDEPDELMDEPSSGEGAWEIVNKRDFNTEV